MAKFKIKRERVGAWLYHQNYFRHYENTPIQIYRKFHLQKPEIFQVKNSYIFHISAQNIDCGYSLEPPRRGGSNEYPQPMFLSRNKKNNVYPCKPQFYYIKVGLRGSKLYRHVFVMVHAVLMHISDLRIQRWVLKSFIVLTATAQTSGHMGLHNVVAGKE